MTTHPNRSQRARFTSTGRTYCTLEYIDWAGEKITRNFYCSGHNGAYVFEDGGKQVCDHLSHRGSTLMMGDEPLVDRIRREYRAMKRIERNAFKA